jgi:hypothetical protein
MTGREVPVVKRVERINEFEVGTVMNISEHITYTFQITKRESGEWEVTDTNIKEKLGDMLSVQVLALKFPAVFTRIIQDEQEPERKLRHPQPRFPAPLDDDLGGEL